ncbi:DivIVA domain-containing protein [Nakamurella antarctica]|uniref:Cell wall synthesis protein Wag31 n=1 Tax=Nakamurella antarctica TaxID=1902245 RepID=A0A3G8ZT67_9ACTN|nr:DivIVA domain-containing protein [Nakamurella antarctica]AZI57674.1 DivIVA domain-containing protein [Nakamurella antarctica]
MRLTPAEVHNVAFKKPSIGKRGYDEDEVDAFLDLVEDELARLIELNNELTSRLAAFESGQTPPPREVAPEPAAPVELVKQPSEPEPEAVVAQPAAPAEPTFQAGGDSHIQAAKLLGLAQQTAERLTADAAQEANETLTTARAESERLLAEAHAESERLVTEATSHSETMVTEATALAEATERDSRVKAESMDRESQRKYTEVMTQLTTQRTALEQKIDDLRTYERDYRSRLRGWITEQLEQLDGSNDGPETEQ